jgi:hypothetical protein
MWPEPLPGLGVVGAGVDGEAPVDGETSGDTLGDGETAACATMVPNPPARPIPAATAILAIEPRNHPRLFIALNHLPGGHAMADRHRVEHGERRLSEA